MKKINTIAVDEILEILKFGFDLQDAFQLSMADSKITSRDLPNFVPSMMSLPNAIMGSNKAIEQFYNLTQEGKQIIFDYIDERFQMDDSMKEYLIEDTLKEIIGDVNVIVRWSNYRKTKN